MKFNERYFTEVIPEPNILDNSSLRKAQIQSYAKIANHFLLEKSSQPAVAILPTGAGKTGVMAIAPFGISKGRVLIITPQLVIKDHVVDSLDPSSPSNFWLKHHVFEDFPNLPVVLEYDNKTLDEELHNSNIVILNIHKLSAQYRKSLLKKVNEDFFDMIIIDEAHHSPAKTWQDALNYFKNAKVLKVTGTPFRTDRKEIEGKIIVNYRLGQAMNEGIVKTLKNFVLKPEKLHLTLDNDSSQTYTLEEIRELGIRDEDYISRSVALSDACNQQIVDSSIEHWKEKTQENKIPHKIIAVCCSINHAEDVKKLYEQTGLRTVIVHSKMKKGDKIEAFRMIESHQTDVVIHVAMLGEGYDHPYLSIAAIFRPYRSLAPYSQFIGRILRRIPDEESKSPSDNIGVVIAHKELGLDKLWEEYKKEKEYCAILEDVKKHESKEKKLEKELSKNTKDVGIVATEGELYFSTEYYEYTLAAQKHEEHEKEIQQKIAELRKTFKKASESELRRLINEETQDHEFNPLINNPKKYRLTLREEFNQKIQYDLPAALLQEYNLDTKGTELSKLSLKDKWILDKGTNDAIIVIFLNNELKKRFSDRDLWTINDYNFAENYLDNDLVPYLRKLIESII